MLISVALLFLGMIISFTRTPRVQEIRKGWIIGLLFAISKINRTSELEKQTYNKPSDGGVGYESL